ncbi:unnamed protein product [Musa banksii]
MHHPIRQRREQGFSSTSFDSKRMELGSHRGLRSNAITYPCLLRHRAEGGVWTATGCSSRSQKKATSHHMKTRSRRRSSSSLWIGPYSLRRGMRRYSSLKKPSPLLQHVDEGRPLAGASPMAFSSISATETPMRRALSKSGRQPS